MSNYVTYIVEYKDDGDIPEVSAGMVVADGALVGVIYDHAMTKIMELEAKIESLEDSLDDCRDGF